MDLPDWSVDCLRQNYGPIWNFRAPLRSGKCDNPTPHFASAGRNWERTDTLDHDRRALLVTLAKHFTASGHLGQKDKAFVELTIAIGERANQEYSAIVVDFDLAIAEIRDLHCDRPSSSSSGDLVDHFLRKRVKHD